MKESRRWGCGYSSQLAGHAVTVQCSHALPDDFVSALLRRLDQVHDIGAQQSPPLCSLSTERGEYCLERRPPFVIEFEFV
ncbi:MAG TPA: hypothetical protein VH062_34105 [Polyangiaceae bacterium]|nr:hypothetical protein [Polyangiaceae bacterium]